jgi:hypothetical protein
MRLIALTGKPRRSDSRAVRSRNDFAVKARPLSWADHFLMVVLGIGLFVPNPGSISAAGVAIITHGLNGNTDGWVTGMADQIPNYERFFGTNYSTYHVYYYYNGSSYDLTNALDVGSEPLTSESGEIILKLDWSQFADGNSYNTYQVASDVVPKLLSTKFIGGLGGHALAELPLHLIGHSRGGSLMYEISRQLGTNGIWVDHLTTLDPHPLNNDGFFDFLYSAVDAPAHTYVNVLFHDNYWQNLNLIANGEPVAGAYIRQLTTLSGGYGGLTGTHSDVHLWYHATLDWRTPAYDTEAYVTSTERQSWWTAYENQGFKAGFYYSLIGGGDRTSTNRPVGSGYPAIRDGYNQWWDLGVGTSGNRTALPTNNGNWPNVLKFNRTTTNEVVQGGTMPVTFYYQWARSNTDLATLDIYLDDDLNPLNTNQTLIEEIPLPGTGASFVGVSATNLILFTSNAAPGWHAVLAKITGAGRTRYLYAPEWVQVVPAREPPVLDIAKIDSAQYRIGVNGLPGQTVILQFSTNLQTWSDMVTNTLTTNRWDYTNTPPTEPGTRYYRGVLP